MTDLEEIKTKLVKAGWFTQPGAHVLVDGQFGSAGKGALAALFGLLFGKQITIATTNAGPNSGHVGNYAISSGTWVQVRTQQIPVAAVVSNALYGKNTTLAYLNGGAIINPNILRAEAEQFGFNFSSLLLHPNAAVIDHDRQNDDVESTNKIASTNKGVGVALARKVLREDCVIKNRRQDVSYFSNVGVHDWDWTKDTVMLETAQGFSLGINQPFYPYVTSRECSVGQALADAAIPYNKVRGVVMAVRTMPIRVGSTDKGHSGGCYPDQQETTWEALGLTPELTTVTKRIRRVFTWSRSQFREAVATNQPSVIFLTFCDYLKEEARKTFLDTMLDDYRGVMGKDPDATLLGFGPYPTDVRAM